MLDTVFSRAVTGGTSAPMRLALSELSRSRLRFGLLAGAVALLVFLLLFLSTLSSTLLASLTGAIENTSADVLVYDDGARRALDASRVDPEVAAQVAAVDGVARAATLRSANLTAQVDGELVDLTLFGYEPGEPGEPSDLVEGRLPDADDEVVVDEADVSVGLEVGKTLVAEPSGVELTVVGLTTDLRTAAAPTGYVTPEAYTRSVLGPAADAPDAQVLPANAITVRVEDGADSVEVAAAITAQVAGVEALDRAQAAASIPGLDAIGQSFGLLVGITFGIVVLVVGFFFLILTVQKLRTFLALRAVGASTALLARSVLLQIALLVLVGVGLATGLLAAAAAFSDASFPIEVEPVLVAAVGVAVLVSSLLAGLVAVRRIARLDPAQAPQLQ